MSRFRQIPVNASISEKAVIIRREQRINLPDAIIKATAHVEEALLVSRNTKDFSVDDPAVRVPYIL